MPGGTRAKLHAAFMSCSEILPALNKSFTFFIKPLGVNEVKSYDPPGPEDAKGAPEASAADGFETPGLGGELRN